MTDIMRYAHDPMVNFNKIPCPLMYNTQICAFKCMCVSVYFAEGPQNLSNRRDEARGRPERWTNVRRERRTNLFLSVLCFSFRFCVSTFPLYSSSSFRLLVLPRPAFRSLRSRSAQSSLIRAWLSAGRILRHRFRHRNAQLLTENYRLFALEFFIEYRFYLNFADDKINGTRSEIKSTYRKSDSCWYLLDYLNRATYIT